VPVALFESPTLERRRYCECCGFPSLFVPDVEPRNRFEWDGSPDWENSGGTCDLCEWESRPLDARGNPVRAPRDDANDRLSLEQARANYARFEWHLRDALAAQQAEDEERVAGEWDDSEELTP